ncbi:hypothetical protein [Phormidesmis sp. 146-33]
MLNHEAKKLCRIHVILAFIICFYSFKRAVTETIANLHKRGFADAGDWSPLLPAPNRSEVMSILSRPRRKG